MSSSHVYFSRIKDYLIAIIGLISAVYLLNFSFGITELLPDNIPLIGHIDEGLAMFFFYSSLSYFGITITSMFKR
jgi:hypothetical protein